MKEEINIGDYVEINAYFNLKWVSDRKGDLIVDDLIVEDIVDKGGGWIVAKLNRSYMQSDGIISNEVLLRHLNIDRKKTRDKIIDDIIK
jgi:hypothetical protein